MPVKACPGDGWVISTQEREREREKKGGTITKDRMCEAKMRKVEHLPGSWCYSIMAQQKSKTINKQLLEER